MGPSSTTSAALSLTVISDQDGNTRLVCIDASAATKD
jgi:hypothetical protein